MTKRFSLATVGLLLGAAAIVAMGWGFRLNHKTLLLAGAVGFLVAWTVGLWKTNVPHLMRRELAAYFYSPIAYVTAAVFLALSGYFFYLIIDNFREACQQGQPFHGEVMGYLLPQVAFTLMFVSPLITMRLLSEEMRSGTIEVLMTAPVTEFEVVISKFLASLLFYGYLLAITLVYVVVVWKVGNPDYGPIITTYLGLIMLGCMFLSVGLFVSSFTRNQIVAAVVTFVVLLLMWLIAYAGGRGGSLLKDVLDFLSLDKQYEAFAKGVVDTRHIIYCLTFTAAVLFLTVRSVEARKWR